MRTDLLCRADPSGRGVKSNDSRLRILSVVDTPLWMDHGTCFEHNSRSMMGRVDDSELSQVPDFFLCY